MLRRNDPHHPQLYCFLGPCGPANSGITLIGSKKGKSYIPKARVTLLPRKLSTMYEPHICSLQATYHAIGWPCSCIHWGYGVCSSLAFGTWNCFFSSKLASNIASGKRHGLVCLSYEPYYFSERTVFFSHNKSANSTFSHDFSAKRTWLVFPRDVVWALNLVNAFNTLWCLHLFSTAMPPIMFW